MAFEQIIVESPVTDEALEKYADVVNQQVLVWTKCTGENNTPTEADYAAEAESTKVVQAKQAVLVKKLEQSLEDPRGVVEDEPRRVERVTVNRGRTANNITRG